jgi:hypothetical protein
MFENHNIRLRNLDVRRGRGDDEGLVHQADHLRLGRGALPPSADQVPEAEAVS